MSDWRGGRVFGIARPGDRPVLLAQGFTNAADLIVDPAKPRLLIPDMGGGTVSAMPTSIPGAEVDERPLALQTAVAFPDLQWAGWKGETEDGRIHTLRPIVLTHAGDGSNRVFVATQHGVIHAFPNDQKATSTTDLPRHPGPGDLQGRDQRGGLPGARVPPAIQGEWVFLRLLHVEGGTADEHRLAVPGPQG